MKLTALIPARGGSKGVPRKNIRNLAGRPLISYSIAACKRSSLIDRVVVSTDDEEIAKIAKECGAEVPFIRPPEFSADKSTDLQVVNHFYSEQGEQDLAFIRPTTPLRDPALLDSFIEKYFSNKDSITGMRSVHELSESPYKFFKIVDGYFTGFFDDFNGVKDYTNLPRQVFPKAYHPNGYIDIVRTSMIEKNLLHGDNVHAFVTEIAYEIDEIDDINFL